MNLFYLVGFTLGFAEEIQGLLSFLRPIKCRSAPCPSWLLKASTVATKLVLTVIIDTSFRAQSNAHWSHWPWIWGSTAQRTPLELGMLGAWLDGCFRAGDSGNCGLLQSWVGKLATIHMGFETCLVGGLHWKLPGFCQHFIEWHIPIEHFELSKLEFADGKMLPRKSSCLVL